MTSDEVNAVTAIRTHPGQQDENILPPPGQVGRLCVQTLDEHLLRRCNMFGYVRVASAYGSGNFINVLHEAFPKSRAPDDVGEEEPMLITSRIKDRDGIYESLRDLFRPGR